ncbi:MAG: hypothetical protein OXU79_18515 [Gemmatimonadota bacterium]|nr:hypothetical protein [Gemmatimonadota bacterium]
MSRCTRFGRGDLEPVTGDWLAYFETPFYLYRWFVGFQAVS